VNSFPTASLYERWECDDTPTKKNNEVHRNFDGRGEDLILTLHPGFHIAVVVAVE
jgi:hypothetical protein